MGTDIRLYPEQRVDGRWKFIGEMEKNSLYEFDPEHEPRSCPKDLYDIRNYSLFAILADVRNDEGYECITRRRGIPDDLSPEIRSWFEYYQGNRADATALPQDEKQRASWIAQDIDLQLQPGWLTLEEMVNFPWHEKRIQIYARVDQRVAHQKMCGLSSGSRLKECIKSRGEFLDECVYRFWPWQPGNIAGAFADDWL